MIHLRSSSGGWLLDRVGVANTVGAGVVLVRTRPRRDVMLRRTTDHDDPTGSRSR